MSWNFEKSLEQQKAIEEAERLNRLAKQKHIQGNLSDITEENSALADLYGLSKEAFHSLASEPDLFKKFLQLVGQDQSETQTQEERVTPVNPRNRTQKTSVGTGKVYNTSKWDPAFKWVPKMESKK